MGMIIGAVPFVMLLFVTGSFDSCLVTATCYVETLRSALLASGPSRSPSPSSVDLDFSSIASRKKPISNSRRTTNVRPANNTRR
jgi:hypothetical protein